MLAGQAVMVNWSDVAVENRPAYYQWHGPEHMVGRVGIPGFRRGRRYLAVRANRDFLVLYEVDDISVLTGQDYMAKANHPSPLTRRTTKLIRNSARALAKVKLSLGIGQGGFMLTLRFDAREGREDQLGRYLMDEALPRVADMAGIVGAHLCVADQTASTVVPVERQGRPTTVPNWIVLIEGISLEAIESACDAQLPKAALYKDGGTAAVERDTYSQQIMVSKMPSWRPQ